MGILAVRQLLVQIYIKYKNIIASVARFLAAFIIFSGIGSLAGGHLFATFGGNILFSAISVFCSPTTFFLLIMAAAAVYISMASVETAIIAVVGIFLTLVFCVRTLPVESLIIPALVFGFYLNIPYAVAILGGLYFGIGAILPIGIGTFVWYVVPELHKFIELTPKAQFSPLGVLDGLVKIYVEFINYITNQKTWFYVACVLMITAVIVYAVRLAAFKLSREVAVITGFFVVFLGSILVKLVGGAQVSILALIVGIILSFFITFIIMYMDCILDYENTQNVQFEDENYYYYVKAVPKIQNIQDSYNKVHDIKHKIKKSVHKNIEN